MRLAITLTLAFFAIVSGMGAYRDLGRALRDPPTGALFRNYSRRLGYRVVCLCSVLDDRKLVTKIEN